MKKLLTVALMAILTVSAYAGGWVGGSVGAWRDGSINKTTVTLLPEIGIKLNSNWDAYASFGWDYTYNKGAKLNQFKINPNIRYTFWRNGKVDIFCDGGASIGIGAAKAHHSKTETSVTYGIGLKPGMAFHASDKITLVAHFGFLGFSSGNNAAKRGGCNEEWGLRFSGDNLTIGASYAF